MIHMNCQALFDLKTNSRIKLSSVAVMISTKSLITPITVLGIILQK